MATHAGDEALSARVGELEAALKRSTSTIDSMRAQMTTLEQERDKLKRELEDARVAQGFAKALGDTTKNFTPTDGNLFGKFWGSMGG